MTSAVMSGLPQAAVINSLAACRASVSDASIPVRNRTGSGNFISAIRYHINFCRKAIALILYKIRIKSASFSKVSRFLIFINYLNPNSLLSISGKIMIICYECNY